MEPVRNVGAFIIVFLILLAVVFLLALPSVIKIFIH